MGAAAKKDMGGDLTPVEAQTKVRRELERLMRIEFTGWVFIHINGGELKLFEQDEAAAIDTEHPAWPTAKRGAVTVDGCVSTLAGCQRERFYGRLSIAMKDGAILPPGPMRRSMTPIRLLP